MGGSADTAMILAREPLAPAVPSAVMWLPGSALNCYTGDAALRSWLLTPGLLTQRIRDACGARFGMHLLCEGLFGTEHVREIDMGPADTPWLFAHTRVPAATLQAEPWLGRIGTRTLGEVLAEHRELQRTAFRYALLDAHATVVARALAHAQLAPQALWVRHSAFDLAGRSFDLYEVFLPSIATAEPQVPETLR
jgi:chorismate--pyruvate lyase